jgi:hypothetical protein
VFIGGEIGGEEEGRPVYFPAKAQNGVYIHYKSRICGKSTKIEIIMQKSHIFRSRFAVQGAFLWAGDGAHWAETEIGVYWRI